jgi:hypothetical protein
MAEDAQWEGRKYGSLHDEDVRSLDLEHELSFISKKFVKKDLYKGEAHWFDSLSVSQRRSLLYVLSKMGREYLRRKRRLRCVHRVQDKEIKQVLKGRSRGTYRVEKDQCALDHAVKPTRPEE